MVSATAPVTPRRGLTRLGRIEGVRHDLSPEPPVRRRSLRRRMLRWAMLALFLFISTALVGFFYWRVVAIAVVEGDVMSLTAPRPVIVEEVFVEPGQWCFEGQPLLRLVAKEVEAKRRVLEARLAQARVRMELSRRGADLEGIDLGRRLDNRDRLAAEIQAAQAAVRRAEAQFDRAAHELERYTDLLEGGQASDREFEAAETTAIAAEAELAQARAYLDGLQVVSNRQERLVPSEGDGTELRQLELAYLEAAVDEAEQRLADFDYETGTRTVVAPFSGRIDRVHVTPGTHREESEPLVSLYDPASLYVVMYVEPKDRERLEVGSDVKMYPEGSWEAIAGKIIEIHDEWTRIPKSIQDSTEHVAAAVTMRVESDAAGRSRLAPHMVLKVVGRSK